jgi:hypothetical protein
MKVLLVNAFKPGAEGDKAFKYFFACVKQAFDVQRYFSKDGISYTCVNYENIDEFLFEPYTGYVDSQAEKKFDYLDFVFIDGEPNLLPWLARAKKFFILMKMCKRTKKVLFAAGCGMFMQIYLNASRYQVNRVINGNGKGTSLKKIHQLSQSDLGTIQQGDVFLDSGTGDMYCYDSESSEFCPIVNIGFHHHKTAADMENRSSILKSFRYIPRNFDFSEPVHPGKRTETVCRVLKQYVQHWLLKDVGLQEFLVSQKNSWDIHAVNVCDKSSCFTILAESDRSPQIITQGNSALVMFNIDAHYPNSAKIVRNFVDHMMQEYSIHQKLDSPLASVPYVVIPCKPCRSNESEKSLSRPITASTAKLDTFVYPGKTHIEIGSRLRPTSSHSGFTISKRKYDPVILANNATKQEPIHINTFFQIERAESLFLPVGTHTDLKIRGSFDKKPITLLKSQLGISNSTVSELKRAASERDLTSSTRQEKHQNELMKILSSQEPCEEENEVTHWTRKDIRNMLHGNESKGNDHQGRKQKIRIVYRSKVQKPRINTNICTTLNVKSKSSKYPFPGSVTNLEPYVDPQKVEIRPSNSNCLWVSKEPFTLAIKKQEERFSGVHYSDPYNPPSSHKFRTEEKNRWVSGEFRVV